MFLFKLIFILSTFTYNFKLYLQNKANKQKNRLFGDLGPFSLLGLAKEWITIF